WRWLHRLLRARIAHGEFEQAGGECEALAERAREAGALAALSGALLIGADVAVLLGDWDAADDLTAEGIRLAREAGQPLMAGYSLSTRVRLTAARGNDEESRAAALAALELAQGLAATARLPFR